MRATLVVDYWDNIRGRYKARYSGAQLETQTTGRCR